MKYAKFATVLALFAARGCSSENPVSEPEAKVISFAGQFSGKNQTSFSVLVLAPCSGDLISLNLAGTGQFTQIGAATVEQAHCARPEPVSSNPLTLEVLYGKIVLAGANGDKIHLDYEGNVVHSANDHPQWKILHHRRHWQVQRRPGQWHLCVRNDRPGQ